MRIALDAMGSDARPGPDVEGAVMAAREYGITVVLVGDESRIKAELAKHATAGLDLPIVHAPDEISMTEHVEAVRARKDASMNVAVRPAIASLTACLMSAAIFEASSTFTVV